MTIINTGSQPFVALCLFLGGMAYSVVCFAARTVKLNKTLTDILYFFISVTGAAAYFSIVFIINSGEMRIYTLITFLLGLYSGYLMLRKLFVKGVK
ncbi:MAG: spore cortex biosynthesis protein YabQ [Christensenellales bacterium]|jgi:hypothetical protein